MFPSGSSPSWRCISLLSIVYTFIIAAVIYRFRTPVAMGLGVLVGMAIYGMNFLVFRPWVSDEEPGVQSLSGTPLVRA